MDKDELRNCRDMQIEISVLENSILRLQDKMNLPRYRELNSRAVECIDQNRCDANSAPSLY